MTDKKTSFVDLPREIRDQVYGFALVSPSIIQVHSLRPLDEINTAFASDCPKFGPDPGGTVRSLKGLSPGLLKTNAQIGREAAETFYSKNKFAFRYQRDWSVISDWLRLIGKRNRGHLGYLEVDVRHLLPAYQRKDGSRELNWEKIVVADQSLYPRHPLLQSPTDHGTWPEGEVENIDPNMEAVFSTLADCDRASKLDLHVRYLGRGYPCCFEDCLDDPQRPVWDNEEEHFSMDLPNLMEAWRAGHSKTAQRQIEVIWHLWGPIYDEKNILDIIGGDLNENGFEVLNSERFEDTADDSVYLERKKPERILRIEMKRRPLAGPIIASEGNPFYEEAENERWIETQL